MGNVTSVTNYRRAKTWQIILAMLSGAGQMTFYMLMTSATYIGNGNFGILVAVTGLVITGSRVFDGVTDPIIAYIIERFSSRFGKIRIFMMIGWACMAIASTLMCNVGASLHITGIDGLLFFIFCYAVYIIGYTFVGVSTSMTGNVMTNDPKQRPTLSVWSTVYSYLTPMTISMVSMAVILPKYNNIQGPDYFSELNIIVIVASLFFYILAALGVSSYDKPENFEGISLTKDKEQKPGFKDMVALLKENKELKRYIIAASSDKLAQTIGSASVVSTMLFGIMIGSMGISSILSAIAMLPSIIFAIIGARIAGKKGNRKTMIQWTWACLILNILYAIFLFATPLTSIGGIFTGGLSGGSIVLAVTFIIFNFGNNGVKMVVSVATNALRMDIIDQELDRSGNYMPATVSAIYGFIDKLVSALGATIATACIAIIGYTSTTPQQGDPLTVGVKLMTIFLLIVFPIIGWICTLCSMKDSKLTYEEMEAVQKRIAEKKAAALLEQNK